MGGAVSHTGNILKLSGDMFDLSAVLEVGL
jgi:hypothetical protein